MADASSGRAGDPADPAGPAADPAAGGAAARVAGLSERDTRILEFERTWWKHVGVKEQAIREQFGMSAARYYQIVGTLLESSAALAFDPMLVRRLQRVRDARTAARSARLLGPGD